MTKKIDMQKCLWLTDGDAKAASLLHELARMYLFKSTCWQVDGLTWFHKPDIATMAATRGCWQKDLKQQLKTLKDMGLIMTRMVHTQGTQLGLMTVSPLTISTLGLKKD